MSAKGFLQLMSVEDVLALCRRISPAPVTPTRRVALLDALGRVAAADVVSTVAVPGFARSAMDGYAVRAEDTFDASADSPVSLRVIGEVPVGAAATVTVGRREAAEIGTGGMMPEGADAVVMVEHTEQLDDQTILIIRRVAPGQNTIRADDDVRPGALCLRAGTVLRATHLGLLAAIGVVEVDVFEPVRVGVLSTGDELAPPNETPGPGQIRDVNSYALMGLVSEAGAAARFYGIIPDEWEPLLAAARRAADENDVVLISGGSSVGTRDLTVQVLNALGEPGVLVHGVAMKPGKPTVIASANGKVFFGLPGRPTSAMVCFHVLIAPLLRRLGGRRVEPQPIRARVTMNVPSEEGKTEFVRARLLEPEPVEAIDESPLQWAEPIFAKSDSVLATTEADALIEIPAGSEGVREGDIVRARLL
jgi:molybdopterin molybdotransferase